MIRLRYGPFKNRAASCSQSDWTTSPADSSDLRPLPFTSGNGSRMATTTRTIPAARMAVVHGGVLPKWQQGSSVTYSVAPAARSPACSSAMTSACGPPNRS